MNVIAFDLDDTLLDTSSCLLPVATAESCQAMMGAGLQCSQDECQKKRKEIAQTDPRNSIFESLALALQPELSGDSQLLNNIVEAGKRAFYEREVNDPLVLCDGALEVLQECFNKYDLFLVSAGDRNTQNQKIDNLGIRNFFKDCLIADPKENMSKLECFQTILNIYPKLEPNQFLSVGNRLDTDIGHAKQLGWKTCYMKYGEYVNMTPVNDFEKPDFQIKGIHQLTKVCQL